MASRSDHIPEARGLGWSLGALQRHYESVVDKVLGDVPHGHRGYQVLAEVSTGHPPSQLALAERLGIDRTVMTYLIDDLVAAGLVERQTNPDDRRQRRIVVTALGRRLLRRLAPKVQAVEDEVLGSLTPEQREVLCTLLRQVAQE